MLIQLFDVLNGEVIPTVHCSTLKDLKAIIDNYPHNYIKIFGYIFYMTCPSPDLNPFFNFPEDTKEDTILVQVGSDFSTEDELIIKAKELCTKLYETPTSRAYNGIKIMLDRLGKYMETTAITSGRDGNGPFLLSAAKQFQDVRQSFKGVYKDLMDEQQSSVRGSSNLAYDAK